MALTFFKSQEFCRFNQYCQRQSSFSYIAYSELIPCQDPSWMAATALLRASHLLASIHLQEPCFKEILDVFEHIHAFMYYAENVYYKTVSKQCNKFDNALANHAKELRNLHTWNIFNKILSLLINNNNNKTIQFNSIFFHF